MAVTRGTLLILRKLQIAVGDEADAATRALTRAWGDAWSNLRSQWRQAVDGLVSHMQTTGAPPTVWELNRLKRLATALQDTEAALGRLQDRAGIDITDAAGRVIHAAADVEPRLISSQLPAAQQATALAQFSGAVTPTALDAIVARTQGQITSTLRPLSAEATAAIRRELVFGVAAGDNPAEVAQRIFDRVEGRFAGGLSRAVNIARTEMLDAQRVAAREIQAANADVVGSWVWMSTLDRRTCVSCWSMHGSVHPLTEPGPMDHQSGRCARVPQTKSWRDLGINIDEPPSAIVDAQAKFWGLPERAQLAIMGPARLELLKSGRVGWGDLAERRRSAAWRDSYVPRPVNRLQTMARQRTAAGEPLTPPTAVDPETAARLRQAAIDRVRPVAEGLSEIEGLLFDDVSEKALAHRMGGMVARRGPNTQPIVDAYQAAAGDRGRLLAALDDIARDHQLQRIGRAGDVVGFDLKLHQGYPGIKHRPGERVMVVRPGYHFQLDDELLRLLKATVDEIDLPPAATAPVLDIFGPRVARAKAGRDALDAAPAGLGRARTALTRPQREALREYQSAMYAAFNGQLRRGEITRAFAGRIRHIDEAMESSRLTDDVVVFRGVKSGRGAFGDRVDGDLTGAEWTERGYLSTSVTRRVAKDFTYADATDTTPMVMRIVVPRGTQAVEISGLDNQAELLLQRGLRLRVVRDHGVIDGERRLDVEVLPARAVPKVARVVDDVADDAPDPTGLDKIEVRRALQGGNADQVAAKFAAEWKRITGRDIEVALPAKVSPQTVREHYEGLLRAAERFPEVRISRVDWWYNTEATYAQALTWADEKRGIIQFAAQYLRSGQGRSAYLRSLARDVKTRYSPAGFETPAAVAIHEFGHVLHMATVDYLAVNVEIRAALERTARRYNFRNPEGDVARGLAAQFDVSRYAATDIDELFAEAFGDVLVNGDAASSLSKEIVAIVERAYRSQFGGPP